VRIAALAVMVILSGFLLAWFTGAYLIGVLIFGIVLSMVAPFFDTPSLRKSGKLTYHSLLFLAEKPRKGIITIHGGTLFDYVFVLDKKMNGKQRTAFIIQQYVEGLVNFIETNDDAAEDMLVRGTSYIINERTAKRMGFDVVKTDFLQLLILTYNYFNITATYSLAKGTLRFPKIGRTKTFETSLQRLKERKQYLIELNEKLKSADGTVSYPSE